MAYAPQAIQNIENAIQAVFAGDENSGIVGDVNHSFGYHLARNELPGDDYSVVLPLDHLGDGGAASACDFKPGGEDGALNAARMILVTNRLLAAAKAHDPRLRALREFCGTTDGLNTHPYDLSNGQEGPLNSWDSSHLWHVHLSFYRAYCNDWASIAPIVDVIAGKPLAGQPAQSAPSSSSYTEEVLIIITAPKRGIAELVPGGKYTFTYAEWAVHDALAHAKPNAYAIQPLTAAQYDALAEKRGKL